MARRKKPIQIILILYIIQRTELKEEQRISNRVFVSLKTIISGLYSFFLAPRRYYVTTVLKKKTKYVRFIVLTKKQKKETRNLASRLRFGYK